MSEGYTYIYQTSHRKFLDLRIPLISLILPNHAQDFDYSFILSFRHTEIIMRRVVPARSTIPERIPTTIEVNCSSYRVHEGEKGGGSRTFAPFAIFHPAQALLSARASYSRDQRDLCARPRGLDVDTLAEDNAIARGEHSRPSWRRRERTRRREWNASARVDAFNVYVRWCVRAHAGVSRQAKENKFLLILSDIRSVYVL